ncbi:MAG: YabP/YqfC family sporulation protein [Clostridiales bacterium]
MSKKEMFRAAVSQTLDIPSELTCDLPRLVISGNKNVFMENHRGIIHYDPNRLEIAFRGGKLEIQGDNLILPILKPDALEISGEIFSLNFIVI